MKKRLISACLVVVIVVADIVTCSAIEGDYNRQTTEGEAIAEVVEDVTGTKNILDRYSCDEQGFEYSNNQSNFDIPNNGDETILIDSGRDSIEIGLPQEVQDCQGLMTDNGTIVYYDESLDSSINVQMVRSGNRLSSVDCIRILETIENENASHKYEFDIDMPQGYKLVSDYDYDDGSEVFDCGEIYIVDDKDNIIDIITEPWAVDSNGNQVETYFEINGSKVVQVIEFDSNSRFPIVADPGIVQTKTVTKEYTKDQIKKVRDQYVGSIPGILSFMLSVGVTVSNVPQPYCKIVGGFCATLCFAGTAYYTKKYNTWNDIWGEMGKNDTCRVTILYKWNNNLETYYPAKITKTKVN